MFLAPLGAAIVGAGASIAGAAAAAAPILTAASAGAGIYSSIKASSQGPAALPTLQQAPRVPDYTAIDAAEKTQILRANQKRTKTILTNPLGETTGGVIQKKQLVGKLGQ